MSSKVKGNAVNDIESEVFTEIQSDNDEYAETESGDRGAEAFDYATQRDADLDEDQDDQVDDGRAVQHARERVSRFDENHAADNAIIEEVQCTNFMCHSRLTIELGPLINFIIGHNGSGKSAVLTALQLCLGGKTTVTNRGNKLADFIKQGTESGSLSVRIKNQGPSAYNADIYGPSIIVERWFTKNGTSGFKIKNSQGRIISTKKQDLEEILDAFALQLDNPMMCLTQDMAREFLNNSTPNHKYKFFMKGTQLETLDSDYKIMSDMLEELELRIDILEGDEKVVHKAYNDAKEKVKRSDENQGLADQHRILLRQMAWCQVEDQEKDLAKIENKIVERKAKIEQVKQKAEEASTAYDEANEASEQATAEAQALAGQIEPINEEKKIASEQLTQQKQEVAKIKAEERGIRSDISAAKKRKAKLENDIALEQQRIADANGGLHAAKLAEWQAAKDEADRLKAEFDDHSRGFRDLEAAKKDAEQAAKDAFPKIQVKRDDLGKCQDKIQLIESRRGQWLTAYGKNWRNLRTLLNLIEKEKARFTDKPIGPMGSFVRILKPEWTSIVERTFGGAFNAFLCTNKRDQGILSQLMKEAQ